MEFTDDKYDEFSGRMMALADSIAALCEGDRGCARTVLGRQGMGYSPKQVEEIVNLPLVGGAVGCDCHILTRCMRHIEALTGERGAKAMAHTVFSWMRRNEGREPSLNSDNQMECMFAQWLADMREAKRNHLTLVD